MSQSLSRRAGRASRTLVTAGVVATIGVWATAAQAGTTMLSGANCTLEGAVERPTNGALLNANGGSASTAKLHCPVPHRQQPSVYGGNLSVALNARLNYSGATYECVLRSVLANGSVHDSTSVVLPPKSSGNGGNWSTSFSVSMPVAQWASVQLRCNVPNEYSGERAGLVSYRIDD